MKKIFIKFLRRKDYINIQSEWDSISKFEIIPVFIGFLAIITLKNNFTSHYFFTIRRNALCVGSLTKEVQWLLVRP